MNELVTEDRKIFLFLFPIKLFDSTGNPPLISTNITTYKFNFMQLLERYLLFQSKGDHALAAIRLGIANEMTYYFQEL